MDRSIWKYRARRDGILRTCSFLACSLLLVPFYATGGGVEVNGSSTSIDKAGNGVPVVNIARPNKRGLSHNKYQRFNVKKKGLILNNSNKATVNTQLGGQIKGNARLNNPASVILNEVTSTHPSKLEGYTEVAGQRADIVIANPNGISINGAGFINSSRVTLTTGIPSIDTEGNLAGFDVQGGSIRIEGDGLNTLDQDATSIYSHYLQLNANLHARDLDIALGVNQIDYPGRKVVSSRESGNVKRVLLDSSLLGGMYANKIVLVGTDKGLGMNLPAQVIASTGDIEITADGRLRLQQLDAAGSIRLQSAQAIDSTASVYAAERVELRANEEIIVQSGMIAANREVSIETNKLQNDASVFAGVVPDQSLGDVGELNLQAQELVNTGELYASHSLNIDSTSVLNQGLLNTDLQLDLHADTLINEATLFSGGDTQLFVREHLLNATDAVIFTLDDLVLAADAGLGRTGQITNHLGLVQSLQGDIDVFAVNFDNLGTADIAYKKYYYDLGKGRKVDKPSDAKNINLAYSSGFTKHNSEARERWVEEVLERLKRQAPLLYAENAPDIRVNRSARFMAIETQLKNKTTTTPAYLDSGGDLSLHVDKYTNKNSVTSAAGNIHFDISDDYRNAASSKKVKVTHYNYYTYADHDRNSRSEDKYSSIGHSGYQSVDRSRKVSAKTVTQAGGDIDGTIGGKLVNDGVLKGKYTSSATLDPDSYGKSGIVLPSNNFGLFVRVTDPDSRYLIETNPRFTSLGNLTGSDYLLDRLGDGPSQLKLLGDAFYESKLIRERVFALTGQRYLNSSISSDNEQFQYLMDNALLAYESLELSPGIALNSKQINRLSSDIVWLVEQQIDGEPVLVPTVYLASGAGSEVSGGRIIAGQQTRLTMATLDNSGLIESGSNLDLEASQAMKNEGLLYAADDLKMVARQDIVNLSGRIEAENIHITSLEGSILNVRGQQNIAYDKGEVNFRAGLLDPAAQIHATGVVELNAARKIAIEGSSISGQEVSLDARTVSIKSSEASESFSAGDSSDHFRESSNRHFASVINGQDIVILSSGKTRISGSDVMAEDTLTVNAGSIVVDAVNDSRFSARKDTIKGQFSLTENSKHSFRSENVGSKLSGATVVLVTDQGDIEITGSEINAREHLTLASAGNIRIQAGQQNKVEESYQRKSQLFSGGALYTESDDLKGRMVTKAVKSQINAGAVDMNADGDIEMTGVDIGVAGELTASARDIVVRNATHEKTKYTRSTEIRIGSGDFEDSLSLDVDAFDDDDGRLRFKLTDAEYHDLDSVTRKSEVVASQIQAGAVQFNADTSTRGDILIEGSDILAAESIELNAGGNVAILDAHSYSSTESKSKGGTAELNFTVQNEYDQAVRAIKAVREAEHDLRDARKEYDRYQDELDDQQQALEQLKQDFADGKGFVEQADVDDFERHLERLEDDEDYYRANIAFASATLVSRVTALIQQTARAAASSGTYGFNASLELDIDAYEREIDEFYQQSRGSSLTANNIEINAGKTATIRGSSLHADEDIVVDARDVEILAGVNTSNRDEMNQHAEFIYRWDMLGGSSTQPPSGVGGSLGGDVSSSNSDTAQHVNSTLKGANVRLVAQDDTLIQGAEIAASDSLEITTGNLTIASVQDHDTSKSQSIGASFSSSSAGINASEGDGERIRTRVTRLTGQQVDIQVAGHTELQGAVVAAVDEKGRDNGQLTLTTNTLNASSLNNTVDEKNRSISVNGAETSSLDYQDDYLTSRTKSLATLGSGEINIEDTEKSDTRFLNRDITDTEVAIYDIESHRGLTGEIDTRLLTEEGRKEVAEDIRRTELLGLSIADVVTKEAVILTDIFQHIGDVQKDLDVQKILATENNGQNALILNNLENATPAEKQQALEAYASAYADIYDIKIESAKLIAIDRLFAGAHNTEGGSSSQIFINDLSQNNALDYANSLAHEITHAQISQDTIRDRGDELNEEYSNLRGRYAEGNYEFSFSNSSLGSVQSGNVNSHLNTDNSATLQNNNGEFLRLDQEKLDYRQLHSVEARLIAITASAFATQQGISTDEAIKRLTEQTMRQIDSNHEDGVLDASAQAWLKDITVAFLKSDDGQFDVEQFSATQEQKDDHDLYANHSKQVNDYLSNADTTEASNIDLFVNGSNGQNSGDSSFASVNAVARIEVRDYAFGSGIYGEGELIYGFIGANNELHPMESMYAYDNSPSIILNPNEINLLLENYSGSDEFSLVHTAAVQSLGLNANLIHRVSNNGVAGLFTAPGQNDVFREAVRYVTDDSPTPALIINNGNTPNNLIVDEASVELGGYLSFADWQNLEAQIQVSEQGDLLNISPQMEYVTAETMQNNLNFMSGFNEHVKSQEGPGAATTSLWTETATNIGLNWEILATDDLAPQYMIDSAKSGVAVDVLAIAPLLKGLTASKGRVDAFSSMSDINFDSKYSGRTITAKVMPGQIKTERPNGGTKIDGKVSLLEKEYIPLNVQFTFKDKYYQTVETTEEVTLYRKFGGRGEQAKMIGGFAGTSSNLNRSESALLKEWNTMQFEAELKIPSGSKLNIGKIAPQPTGEINPKYRGNADQVLLPKDYPLEWVESVKDWKTGSTYSLEEFIEKFPNQIKKY